MMKELIRHLWRQHSELITEKSLLNCHCRGVHSIMLIEKPGQTIRLFIAEKGNELEHNYKINDNKMTVAYHPHHCDITIHCIKGEVFNRIIKESKEGYEVQKFLYQSKIKSEDIKFIKHGNVLISTVEATCIFAGQSLFLSASDIHTVACPPHQLSAWFVFEGREDQSYTPYCYSAFDLTKADFSGMYEKSSKEYIEQLLNNCDLL